MIRIYFEELFALINSLYLVTVCAFKNTPEENLVLEMGARLAIRDPCVYI